MTVYVVEINVKAEHVDDFIRACGDNHRNTRKEPGNLRFDLIRSSEDPCAFTLYEVYRSPEAVTAHKETPHYLAWRRIVEPWMAAPRKGRQFESVYPVNELEW